MSKRLTDNEFYCIVGGLRLDYEIRQHMKSIKQELGASFANVAKRLEVHFEISPQHPSRINK